MKTKTTVILIISVLCLILFAPKASALTQDEAIAEQEAALYVEGVSELLPNNIVNLLDDIGVNTSSPTESMKTFKISDLFSCIKSEFSSVITTPLHALATMLGVILISSLIGDEKHRVLRISASVASATILVIPIAALAASACEIISAASVFISGIVPVISSLSTSSGFPVSSVFMSSCMVAVSDLLAVISSKMLLPIVCISLAFSSVSVVVPELKVEKLASSFRTFAIWAIGAALAIYLTFVGIQSGITSSLDGLAKKTVKITVSSAIPLVGSVISDASETVLGATELIKSGFGGFALVAIVLIFVKPLLSAVLWAISLKICEFAASAFGNDDIATLSGATQKTVTVILSLLVSIMVAITVTIALVIKMKG